MDKRFKIISIRAINFKILEGIEYVIPEDKDKTIISGKNGSGKSTFLDTFPALLLGKLPNLNTGVDRKINNAVRRDAKSEWAELFGIIEDCDSKQYLIRTKINKDGKAVVGVFRDGKRKVARQKEFLEAIVSKGLVFDPTYIISTKGQDRKKQVKEYLNINTSKLDNDLAIAEEERKYIKRDIDKSEKILESELDNSNFELDDELEEVDYNYLIDQISKVEKRKLLMDELDKLNSEITISDPSEVSDIIKRKESYEQDKKRNKKIIDERESLTALKIELHNAQTKIDSTKKKIRKIISESGIDNLEFGEEDILIDGVEFNQLSTGQKLKAAIKIMSKNNHTNIVCIRNGSELDDDNLDDLVKYCNENGFHAIIELVGDQDNSDLIFRDGIVEKVEDLI